MNDQTMENFTSDQTDDEKQEHVIQANEYLEIVKNLAFAAIIAFAAGWLITIVASMVVGYAEIPTMGEMRVNGEGEEYFHAYYPDFRKYAITSAESPHGTEKSKFGEMGNIATGLYIYSICNAFHWMLELKIKNYGIILLIPFFTFIGAGILLYLKFLPTQYRIQDNAVMYTVGLAVIHSILVMLFVLMFYYWKPTFASLYASRYVYVGQLLGLTLPSAFVILMTNVVYGATAGAIVNGLISLGLLPTAENHVDQ